MAAEEKYEKKLASGKKGGYTPLKNEDPDAEQSIGTELGDMIEGAAHLNITGILHVRARKKLRSKERDMADVFGDITNKEYVLEVEILAITNMTTLKLEDGIDRRKFWWGILGFVIYLLVYAGIMFLAEWHTDTGMNEYKESIWFALITVTTLGYGDIYPQTTWSKVLNSFFIMINVFVIATFVSNLLGYVVDAGEASLNNRMDHMMNGVHDVFKHTEESKMSKAKQIAEKRSPAHKDEHKRSKSLGASVYHELVKSKDESRERHGSVPNINLQGLYVHNFVHPSTR